MREMEIRFGDGGIILQLGGKGKKVTTSVISASGVLPKKRPPENLQGYRLSP